MNIFLSYASASKPLAEELCHRLQAAGHQVFFDREDLPAGQSFDAHIRSAIESCQLFVFLVTPEAVSAGRYTLTELKLAARRWPTPGVHVLPVLAAATPFEDIPAYLRALNLLQPAGNLPAEVLIEVQDRSAALQAAADQSRLLAEAAEAAAAKAEAASLQPPPDKTSAAPRYRTLTLRFEQQGQQLQLQLPGSEPQPLLLDLPALELRLWANAADLGDSARRASSQAARVPNAEAARAVGQALHEAIFGSAAGAGLQAQLRAIDPQSGDGLRVVIDTTAAPALARLPWEFLYDAGQEDFVFSDRLKPLVRRLDVDAPPPRLALKPPLRLLVAVASPIGRPDLQVGTELAQMDRALSSLSDSGQLATYRLDHTTLEALDEALLQHQPHVLHFIGHGDFDGDEGRLLLEGEGGTAAPIAGRQLAVLLRNHLRNLRLVFLNNCMGATASPVDAFGGVAQSLLRRGLPAVVAMQFPIADADALTLARHFYRYLAAGQPVDTALTSARAFMVARGDAVAWGAAALYMNAEDGRLFDLLPPASATAPGAVVSAAPTPPPPPPPVPPPARPPTSAPPSAAASSPNKGQRWGILAVVLLLLGAASVWLSLSFEQDSAKVESAAPPPDDGAAGARSPSVAQDAPSAPATGKAAAVIALLQANQVAQAQGVLDQASAAEWAQWRTSGQAAPLAAALLDAAERAADGGSDTLAAAVLQQLDSLGALGAAANSRAEALNRRLLPEPQTAPAMAAPVPLPVPAPAPAPASASASAPAPEPTPTPALSGGWQPKPYTIRQGDSLWSLSARFQGRPLRWRQLWQQHQLAAQRGAVPPIANPDLLQIGQPLWLPLQASAAAVTVSYHVQDGESLSLIARRVYGRAELWPLIQQANGLSNPDVIRPGQVLQLPARP